MSNHHDIDLHKIARTAIEQYGFDFNPAKPIIDEISALNPRKLLDNAQGEARDLRGLLWSSIDNTESLDLDQLEYCVYGTGGEIIVRVAIADVDLFVPKNSQTDIYAAHNGTSVYTGIDVFPMFPNRLSNELTSLLPDADHDVEVIEFSVFPDGAITSGGVYRALIRNKAKLVYEEIGDWIEGKTGVPVSVARVPGLKEQLELQDEAAERLSKFRVEQGALEFDTIEAKPVIREEKVIALIIQEKNRARSIIENFMIAANVTMSQFLRSAGIPMIQRVVRVPRNWQGIMKVAAAFHETLPLQPDAKALAQFLNKRRIADPEMFPDLSLTIVKLLGPGEYVMLEPQGSSIGHFGLAVMDYIHGTAPNRRYVDVIIQRLLKSVLDREPCPYSQNELINCATRCTDRDTAAKKVERFMRKAAAAVLLGGRIGESFDAIVTGASDKGTYVRIVMPPAEGRVMRGEKGLVVGQKIRVRLIGMNPYKGQIDFENS
ncbi:MAG: RNB domain-containing ribonuclease, partial [Candidatus Omnitrophica bacterium]|nr:RNB domain-containing ribonuclease [Candidatus Omnitrophota bacterium]